MSRTDVISNVCPDSVPAICDALAILFEPFVEVVLHDWGSQTITHLSGTFSNRKIGDPSFIDELDVATNLNTVFGPYRKTDAHGRQIKSISILIRDQTGDPASLLCINVDISRFEAASALLSQFVSIPKLQQDNPLADDWLDTLNSFVAKWRIKQGVGDGQLNLEARHELLRLLHARGVFDRSKAADAVATAVNVSRATIYNDLKALSLSKG